MEFKTMYEKYVNILTEINKLDLQKVQNTPLENVWCAIRTEDEYSLVEIQLWLNTEQDDIQISLMVMYDETVLINYDVKHRSVEETLDVLQKTLAACKYLEAAHDIIGNYEMGR